MISLCFHAPYHGLWVLGFFSKRLTPFLLNSHQRRARTGGQAGDACGVFQIAFFMPPLNKGYRSRHCLYSSHTLSLRCKAETAAPWRFISPPAKPDRHLTIFYDHIVLPLRYWLCFPHWRWSSCLHNRMAFALTHFILNRQEWQSCSQHTIIMIPAWLGRQDIPVMDEDLIACFKYVGIQNWMNNVVNNTVWGAETSIKLQLVHTYTCTQYK